MYSILITTFKKESGDIVGKGIYCKHYKTKNYASKIAKNLTLDINEKYTQTASVFEEVLNQEPMS